MHEVYSNLVTFVGKKCPDNFNKKFYLRDKIARRYAVIFIIRLD